MGWWVTQITHLQGCLVFDLFYIFVVVQSKWIHSIYFVRVVQSKF